jgi:hypothetical protein
VRYLKQHWIKCLKGVCPVLFVFYPKVVNRAVENLGLKEFSEFHEKWICYVLKGAVAEVVLFYPIQSLTLSPDLVFIGSRGLQEACLWSL